VVTPVGHGLGIRRFAASFPGGDCVVRAVVFIGDGLTNFWDFVSWWVGCVVRYTYKFGGWFSADSAGCSLGRFNHWWRSVWVSVFGEGGFHTSVALASTVLLGHL
jgi:hypothetical protein